MSTENHTVPPVTTVTSVETKSTEVKTTASLSDPSEITTASTLATNALSTATQPPVSLNSTTPTAKPLVPTSDSKTEPSNQPVSLNDGVPEKQQLPSESTNVPCKQQEQNENLKDSNEKNEKTVVVKKTSETVSNVTEIKPKSPSTGPAVGNAVKNPIKAADSLNTSKKDSKYASGDKSAPKQAPIPDTSTSKEFQGKQMLSSDDKESRVEPSSNAETPDTRLKGTEAPKPKITDIKSSELPANPTVPVPSVGSPTLEPKFIENQKPSSSEKKVVTPQITKYTDLITENAALLTDIGNDKADINKVPEDIKSKTTTSNPPPTIPNEKVAVHKVDKPSPNIEIAPMNDKKIVSNDKAVENILENQAKNINATPLATKPIATENQKSNVSSVPTVAPIVEKPCSAQPKLTQSTTVASQNISATPTTKAPSFPNEKKSVNLDKEEVSPSANANQTSQISKPEKPVLSTSTSQSPLKQSFPVTQSTTTPPVTQALQASVPAAAKPFDPKANGASQVNSKESTPVPSAASPETNQSTLYPSPDLHRKSNSPSSSRLNVGPPRPRTANVAPVIPPKQTKPAESESSVSESTYTQKAAHDVQSSRPNPTSAESHGAYQWPMHAMAAAASSAGSGSAYTSSAGSYGSSNMTGAYGTEGTFGGSNSATAHAQNPFMNPLMTQMRQSNPQAAAMLAFAAAASAAQQQMAQKQQQQQHQLQHQQQQLQHYQQHYQQQHHHQQQAHHQQSHHQQHSHHPQQQHHSQHTAVPQQQPPPAHHSHQQQRNQVWPTAAYGSPAHSTPSSHSKTNQQVAHATSHHSLTGLTQPPTSNQTSKNVPTSNLTPLKPAHTPSAASTVPSKHSQSTTSAMPSKPGVSQHTPVVPPKAQSLSSPKETNIPYSHKVTNPTSKVLPFPKQAHNSSSTNLTSTKSSTPISSNTKAAEKLPDSNMSAPHKTATIPSTNIGTTKASPSSVTTKLPTPPASQPIKAVLPPKSTEQTIKPLINKEPSKLEAKLDESLKKRKDVKNDQKSSLTDREARHISSDTKVQNSPENKSEARNQTNEKTNNDKKVETKLEVKSAVKESKLKPTKSSLPDTEKIVPPLKLHKMMAATSPPIPEEKVPPLKLSKIPSPPKGAQEQRTVAPLKLGKLPQLKSPKPAEKKPRKRPLSKVQAPPLPVRESKRARKQVEQFESPDPEMQQIMKSIKLQEEAEKEKKEPKESKVSEKAKEEIEEEMPLKIRGKARGKLRGSVSKETIKTILEPPPQDDVKVPEKIVVAAKKDAVFFKGEHLAVRNAEGSFYMCQTLQQVYKTSKKIRIQWLSEKQESNPNKDIYIPEYYDQTEFATILTSVELDKHGKKMFKLPKSEEERIKNILKRAFDKESGKLDENDVRLTEDNPDGLDISIYKDEDQLKDLERRKKEVERTKSNKGKQKGRPKKEAPKKPEAVNEVSSTNDSTKIKEPVVPTLPEQKKDEKLDDEDVKLALSKGRTSKSKSIQPNVKPTSSREPRSQSRAKVSEPSAESLELNKPLTINETPVVDEIKITRKAPGRPGRKASEAQPVKPVTVSNATKNNKETSAMSKKEKKPTDVNEAKPKTNKATEKLPAALTNKAETKQKTNKNEVNNKEPKEISKPATPVKVPQKGSKRNAEKEVFDFEDDFEEEVMPIPKKRAALKTYEEAEKETKNIANKTLSSPSPTKSKTIKSDSNIPDSDEKCESSVAVSPNKTLDPPKSSKRGRGRSRK